MTRIHFVTIDFSLKNEIHIFSFFDKRIHNHIFTQLIRVVNSK